MKGSSTFISACLAASFLAAGCSKGLEDTFDKQETDIEAIVTSLTKSESPDTLSYQKGSVRVTVVKGEGDPLRKDGTVSFWYAGYGISGTSISAENLFATNKKDLAASSGWSVSDSTIFAIRKLDLSSEDIVEGLRNGIVGARSGDECYVLFSGEYGFGKRKTGSVPANSALAYHLWIESVSNK